MVIVYVLPGKSGDYKVVQLEIKGQEHIRFGDGDKGHSGCLTHILEIEEGRFGLSPRFTGGPIRFTDLKYASELGLTDVQTYETVQDHGSERQIPAIVGSGYRVLGMGNAHIFVPDKSIIFFGRSLSYKIGFDKDQIERFRRQIPEWKIEVK